MKKSETILIGIGIFALILNVFLPFPGSTTFFILPFMVLSCVYFYLGFALFNDIRFRRILKKESYKNISSLKILGAVGLGISLSITLVGILFKVMFWPGSYFNLIFGIISLILIVIISLLKYSKNKSEFYTRIFKRSALFGGIALVAFFTPNANLVDIKYRNEPEYAKALKNTMEDPDNIEYQEKLRIEREKMDTDNNGA